MSQSGHLSETSTRVIHKTGHSNLYLYNSPNVEICGILFFKEVTHLLLML